MLASPQTTLSRKPRRASGKLGSEVVWPIRREGWNQVQVIARQDIVKSTF